MKPTLIPELRAKVFPLVGILAQHVAERIRKENGDAGEPSHSDVRGAEEKLIRSRDED